MITSLVLDDRSMMHIVSSMAQQKTVGTIVISGANIYQESHKIWALLICACLAFKDLRHHPISLLFVLLHESTDTKHTAQTSGNLESAI